MPKVKFNKPIDSLQNPRNLAIRDAMRPPVVEGINLDGFTGKPRQIVRVKATDDFRVVEVKVSVHGPGGSGGVKGAKNCPNRPQLYAAALEPLA